MSALFIVSGAIGYTLSKRARIASGTPLSDGVIWWQIWIGLAAALVATYFWRRGLRSIRASPETPRTLLQPSTPGTLAPRAPWHPGTLAPRAPWHPGQLAKGYASFTGNGGHDGTFGFDGVWAANSPNLQEDFAWRHNHVITVAAKAIATKFYGQPIARSYMAGCSKGGHGALMEAQRFPEDFDGLIAAAPVYDLTGRVMAGAWWAKAVSDD